MDDRLKLIGRLKFIRDYECKTNAEIRAMNEAITALSAEPQITYQYCAKALMKLWDDDVIMFCEYDRIMDRLKKRMEADNEAD